MEDQGFSLTGFLKEVGDSALDVGKLYATQKIEDKNQIVTVSPGVLAKAGETSSAKAPLNLSAEDSFLINGVPVNKMAVYVTGGILTLIVVVWAVK